MATISVGMIMGIFLAIVFLIFFSGGGVSLIWNISNFLKSIPTFAWVILGIIILFRIFGGRRRR